MGLLLATSSRHTNDRDIITITKTPPSPLIHTLTLLCISPAFRSWSYSGRRVSGCWFQPNRLRHILINSISTVSSTDHSISNSTCIESWGSCRWFPHPVNKHRGVLISRIKERSHGGFRSCALLQDVAEKVTYKWAKEWCHARCSQRRWRGRGGKETGSEDGGGRREKEHSEMLTSEVVYIREFRTEAGRFEVNASFRTTRTRSIFVFVLHLLWLALLLRLTCDDRMWLSAQVGRYLRIYQQKRDITFYCGMGICGRGMTDTCFLGKEYYRRMIGKFGLVNIHGLVVIDDLVQSHTAMGVDLEENWHYEESTTYPNRLWIRTQAGSIDALQALADPREGYFSK